MPGFSYEILPHKGKKPWYLRVGLHLDEDELHYYFYTEEEAKEFGWYLLGKFLNERLS